MKKNRLLSLICAVVMLFNLSGVATAEDGIEPYASAYLDGCSVQLRAKGNGKMAVDVTVDSVGEKADKIGLLGIDIEQQKNGKWYFYDTLDAVDHPEFFDYDSWDYVNTIPFDGVAGYYFRVTITAYAKRGSGFDTMYLISNSILCT